MKDQYKAVVGLLIVLAFCIGATGDASLNTEPSTKTNTLSPVGCSGNIYLSSQAQVDSFPTTYGCSEIAGTLTISGNDITNLDSLHLVTKVDGYMFIDSNPNLSDLTGLSSLSYVGGGGAHITYNPKLTNLDGLDNLTAIAGPLNVSNNATLTNVDGLRSLSSLKSVFPDYQCLTISNNPALTSLRGLLSITSLPGPLVIENNAVLPNLDGLNSLVSINGHVADLRVVGNASLSNIDGLSALTEVTGRYPWVIISNNPSLPNLNGLSSLKQISGGPPSSLEISNNNSLQNLDALSSLTISGAMTYLTVTNNPQLAGGCGLFNALNIMTSPTCYCGPHVSISGNGTGCTEEEILASGPCCTSPDGCSPTEPSSQPTNLSFTNITTNSMDVSFTPPASPPMGYITLMRPSSSPYPDDVPVDNTVYHLGGSIGNCIIVGLGSETSFSVTNLGSSVVYYFDVFSYNGTNYLATNPLGGSQRTASTEPGAQPTDMIFSAVTDTTMTVSFTPASPAPSGYLTLMQAYGAPYPDDAPVDGTTYHTGDVIGSSTIVINVGSETSLDVTYLIPGVDYYFDVFSYNIFNGTYYYRAVNPLEGDQSTISSGSVSARRASESVSKSTAYSSLESQDHLHPFPNPFSEGTTIPFTTNGQNTFVQISIYDLTGRKITDVVNQNFTPGYHEVKWLGTDNLGIKVPQGIYVYHIRISESKDEIRGLLLAK